MTGELCRITVRAPSISFELGIPEDVPLTDLLPVLVEYAGPELHERGLDHGGWTLQRLGAAPLEEDRTAASLGLRDGETLYLRARHETLPEVAFDDLVEGIGDTLRARPDTWRPALTRRLLLGFAAAALLAGLATLALPGEPLWRAGTAGALALLLLAGALTASRAVGDAGAGAVLGLLAVPHLALAGALIPQAGAGEDPLGPRLLAASAAAAGAAVVALAAVGAFAPLFLGAFTVALFGALGAAATSAGLPLAQSAGWIAVLTVVTCGFAPGLAFRFAGMRLPSLPTGADDLQEGIASFPAERVKARAALADSYLTGIYTAFGIVAVGCQTALLTADGSQGWTGPALAVALGLLFLLHVRVVGATWHRLALAGSGAYGLAATAVVLATRTGLPDRLGATAVLAVLGAVAAVAAWTVPGRRLVPYWGRAADVLHLLSALALLPLAALLSGVFGALRAIRG
ncbi:type VII secretion integral membrane protein EccD [Streptomyces sp. NPDC056796]|uniref:type VII secretion integral membrane protein EccD n=1 Tax=unclassified Streptomyces TaxID=2593676 RepID=UPI0036C1DD7B